MNLPDKVVDKVDDWLVRLLGDATKELGGMLTDWVRYFRAKRIVDLRIKYDQHLKRRGIVEPLPVPPKYAFPIIEHASLEDDDTLLDVWAKLLATASDPDHSTQVRAAFIGIIEELDPLDVYLLDSMYQQISALERSGHAKWVIKTHRLVKWVSESCDITYTEQDIRISVDNLIRLRCVEIALEDKEINIPDEHIAGRSRPHIVSVSHGADRIALTALGRAFVQACIAVADSKLEDNPE